MTVAEKMDAATASMNRRRRLEAVSHLILIARGLVVPIQHQVRVPHRVHHRPQAIQEEVTVVVPQQNHIKIHFHELFKLG